MGSARVLAVSDSHLSTRTPDAHRHWGAVLELVAADPPDLVVHAGDLSTDGALRPEDLADARAAIDRVPVPVASVPGNHDVGDGAAWSQAPGEAVVGPGTLARFGEVFGADRFSVTVGAWRLIGLDAQVMGSGEGAEDEQWRWLAAAVGDVPSGVPVALVLHKPLVPPDGDRDSPHRYVPVAARRRLLGLVAGLDVRLVVSGHVHQSLVHERDGVRHVWVPSCWGLVPDWIQRTVGVKRLGAVALTLHDDGTADVDEVRLPGVADVVIGTDVPSPYPEPDGPID
jgi:3',5'-cyclic AMP phosphodiesterase CpdA